MSEMNDVNIKDVLNKFVIESVMFKSAIKLAYKKDSRPTVLSLHCCYGNFLKQMLLFFAGSYFAHYCS